MIMNLYEDTYIIQHNFQLMSLNYLLGRFILFI